MWVIASQGNVFGGKRFWLRPGKAHLIGRTAVDPTVDKSSAIIIDDKTVSRKHLSIIVDVPTAENCANTKTRSKVTLDDHNTKIGTLVDGVQIRGRPHVLEKDVNVIQIGRYKDLFIISWIPVTLTTSFKKKELSAGAQTALYNTLGPLDIKVLTKYEHGVTTHLLTSKRNTSMGLQALIDGKYIVDHEKYLEVITKVTSPGAEGKSLLEEDWDTNFPDPLKYLPAKGEEPTSRDETAYAPSPDRKDMFDGYTFVFTNSTQYNNLLAPISEGGGKALFREAVPSQTDLDDFVRYVKSVAGEKGLGSFNDGSEGKGVVVVRFNPAKGAKSLADDIEWFHDFNRNVSIRLDHRLVEQNEFLDAILGADASVLRRPLEIEQSDIVAPQPITTASSRKSSRTLPVSSPAEPVVTEMAPPPPAERKKSRFKKETAPKFRGFESDEEEEQPSIVPSSVPEPMEIDEAPPVAPESQGLFCTQDPTWDISHDTTTRSTRSSRKRNTPSVDYGGDDEPQESIMAQVAPYTTALKKRRIDADAPSEATPTPSFLTSTAPIPKKKKAPSRSPTPEPKIKHELDVVQIAQERMARAEELARANRAFEASELEDIDAAEIRALTLTETLPMRQSGAVSRASRADESDRWDDAWNGRKNFKKFRRRGGEVAGGRRVIVQLEGWKRKEYGVSEDYWLETEAARKQKERERDFAASQAVETQTRLSFQQSVALGRGDQRSEPESEEEDEDEDVAPRSRAGVRISQRESEAPPPASAASSMSKKRSAEAPLLRGAAKKSRLQQQEESESDSSDDGTKFRFGRRK